MNAAIERRISRLEQQAGVGEVTLADKLIAAIRQLGHEAVHAWLEKAEQAHRGEFYARLVLGDWLHRFFYCGAPFALEQLRGLVPDEAIRHAYNQRRNYGMSADDAKRVRQLAGVMDEDGNVMPGFVLNDNGCINDAPGR